ncbi:MAG: hypothetical protein EOM17_15775, partial [Synergistales bacterium]|nr:hypothetical protein [Synergistales bacterium]
LSGEYFSDWESWFTDHAAGRTTLLRCNTWLQLHVLRLPVVNEVVTDGKELLRYNDYGTWDTTFLYDRAGEIGDELLSLEQEIKTLGGSFYYLGLPEQCTYFMDDYPNYLESRAWNVAVIRDSFSRALNERGIHYIDAARIYEELGHPDRLYSSTDHHYTIYGAWTAYRAVMEQINADRGWKLNILEQEDLNWIELPNPFLGSHNRKLFGLCGKGERLTVGVLKQPVAFTRTDNGSPVDASVLAMPADGDIAVTYNVFMGGDRAETIIRTDRPELPDLLIFGDSFTNAVETMIYAGFDETRSLDLRYYTEKTLKEYLAEFRPDIVLCIRDDTAFFTRTGNGKLD